MRTGLTLALAVAAALAGACAQVTRSAPVRVQEVALRSGELVAVVADNSRAPEIHSGLRSLVHSSDPEANAFDPEPGSTGLHFEHLVSAYRDRANRFAPRQGRTRLFALPGGAEAVLVRDARDSPWQMASQLGYRLRAPHYVDLDFRARPAQVRWFGRRGYAAFVFTSTMNDVLVPDLQFPGATAEGEPLGWVRADAPEGHPQWKGGGTYRGVGAAELEFEERHNLRELLWTYDAPRVAEPYFLGRLANGMVFAVLFDRLVTDTDEIRFGLHASEPRPPGRPVWSFQYVIRRLEVDRVHGFRARVIYKPFAGEDDIRDEYARWMAELREAGGAAAPQASSR